jgi:cation diffusion facilitator family transporter
MKYETRPHHGHTHGPGGHDHGTGLLGELRGIFGHSHSIEDKIDDEMEGNERGIRALKITLVILLITSALQVAVVLFSGSVALLADTIHNFGDATTSIPLWIAFALAKRGASRRFTYGYGKVEDVAGAVIVLIIFFSACVAAYESVQKLIHPNTITNIGWVAVAALIGFLGNEAVAVFRLRVGRAIGSAALVADGMHARVDGFTSLAVLIGVAGVWAGVPILDPIIGIGITIAILFIVKDAASAVWRRLIDGIEPETVDEIAQTASRVPGVERVERVRARWIGHRLQADLTLVLATDQSFEESAAVMLAVRRALLTHMHRVALLTVEALPPSAVDSAARIRREAASILPPRYQDPNVAVSAAPMGAADLIYNADGSVAWDEVWTGFCDLALAGGPPHRGALLEPVDPQDIEADPEGYERVLQELERGITLVTGQLTKRSDALGWIGMVCESDEMALWLLRAIIVENVTVRREGNVLWFPAGPKFRLPYEIKNVVTVIGKTNHYWQEHAQALPR